MPYWERRGYYNGLLNYLANVTVRDKIYIFSRECIGAIRERIAIRLLDRSEGVPQPLAESSTLIDSGMKIRGCEAASHEDNIYLLVNGVTLRGLEWSHSFILLIYDFVAKSWSRPQTSGPTPSPQERSIGGCLIGRTIFVYQCTLRQLLWSRSVYALDIEKMEWSLRHVSLVQSWDYAVERLLSWNNILVGVGRQTYLGRPHEIVFPVVQDQWNVSLFDTSTNSWLMPQSSGKPALGLYMDCMAVYRDKLLVISKGKDFRFMRATPTIYLFDLNNYAWSIVDYKGTPAERSETPTCCLRVNHLIYCITVCIGMPSRTVIDVLNMKTKSLTKQCVQICEAAPDVSRLCSAILISSKKANVEM